MLVDHKYVICYRVRRAAVRRNYPGEPAGSHNLSSDFTQMLRPLAAVCLLAIGLGGVRADTPLWIQRQEAQRWMPALQVAADRTGLPVAVIAELIGAESGFRSIPNAHSSAFGMGQQIRGNRVMWLYGLNRAQPEDSILGAALELREGFDRSSTLAGALQRYGTTVAMTPARRKQTVARFEAAARYEPSAMPATITAIDSHAPATELHSTSLMAGARTGRSSAAPAARPRGLVRSPA